MRVGFARWISADGGEVVDKVEALDVATRQIADILPDNGAVRLCPEDKHRLKSVHKVVDKSYLMPIPEQRLNQQSALVASSTRNGNVQSYPFPVANTSKLQVLQAFSASEHDLPVVGGGRTVRLEELAAIQHAKTS